MVGQDLHDSWFNINGCVTNMTHFVDRLFYFHVAETCSPMLTGFFLMYMASSLSWVQWLLCAIQYFAQCIREPGHLRGQSSKLILRNDFS